MRQERVLTLTRDQSVHPTRTEVSDARDGMFILGHELCCRFCSEDCVAPPRPECSFSLNSSFARRLAVHVLIAVLDTHKIPMLTWYPGLMACRCVSESTRLLSSVLDIAFSWYTQLAIRYAMERKWKRAMEILPPMGNQDSIQDGVIKFDT